MSIAGARSNRGDAYQVVVAVDWALRLISDRSIAWIEVDSTSLMPDGTPISVDDVVVGFTTGRTICCQCKKNQKNFEAWTLEELEGELGKAGRLLIRDAAAEVRFYSRADFGQVAKLAELASQVPDMTAFEQAVGANLRPALTKLQRCWAGELEAGTQTAHALLVRISFFITPSTNDYRARIKERLQHMVTRVDDAFNALWTTFDNLGAHLSDGRASVSGHRITRAEVEELLATAGSSIAPPRSQAEIAKSFGTMSAIGRQWRRDIGGKVLDRAAANELLDGIAAKARTVLLTDGPGAGKTCLLLSVVETLERNSSVATLFLQAREFADAKGHAERVSRGLAADIPALVSGMSQWRHTVVVIDSLDVLSLSRDHEGLSFFLGLIDRLGQIPNVTVVAACRNFDLHYNRRLADRRWDLTIRVGQLDWTETVEPMMHDWGVDPTALSAPARGLLANPRNLALFREIVSKPGAHNVTSTQELTEAYLEVVVRGDPQLGDSAMSAIGAMASEMLASRRLEVPRDSIGFGDSVRNRLMSADVLIEGRSGRIGFGHQTLLDALAVRDAARRDLSFLEFIRSLPPVPFVRPAIRAFFTHLRLGDSRVFRSQVRAVFEADVAFHIKRLVAESLAALEPEVDDWSLLRHLFQRHEVHFRFLYAAAAGRGWHSYWMTNLVPDLIATENAGWLATHVRRVSIWAGEDPTGVIAFWTSALTFDWARDMNLHATLGHELARLSLPEEADVLPLLEALNALPTVKHDFLGGAIQKFVKSTDRGNALLWRYITGDVSHDHLTSYRLDDVLRCGREWFRDNGFLSRRMSESVELLETAVSALEKWSGIVAQRSRAAGEWNQVFLEDTSYGATHSRHDMRHVTPTAVLLGAVEAAVLENAGEHSDWWRANRHRICLNACGALRHMGLLALTTYPEANAAEAKAVLLDDRVLDSTGEFELGNLIGATAYFVGDVLDRVEERVLSRREDSLQEAPHWVLAERLGLLQRIPASLRSENVTEAIRGLSATLPPPSGLPDIHSTSGAVVPPFGFEEFLQLGDAALIELLEEAKDLRRDRFDPLRLVGGVEQIGAQLHTAASKHPRRFLELLASSWSRIDEQFRAPLLEGAAAYLRYRHGNLQPPTSPWTAVEEIGGALLGSLIIDELERHPGFWSMTRSGAAALEACAYFAKTDDLADRLLFFAAGYAFAPDPACGEQLGDDLLTTGINCSRGQVADALMVIANDRVEAGVAFPQLLSPTLRRLAHDCHPAVRTVILRRLPFLQFKSPLGWELFDATVDCEDDRVLLSAELCLYHSYEAQFARIQPVLARMASSAVQGVREIWGRISALASMSGHIPRHRLLAELAHMNDANAWNGAISVWMTNAHLAKHREACFSALTFAFEHDAAQGGALREANLLFRRQNPATLVPASIFRALLQWQTKEEPGRLNIYGIEDWLGALAEREPDLALDAATSLAEAARSGTVALYDPDPVARLLTTLFREAEEREEADSGQMLRRVIQVQDVFLAGPLDSLSQWLRDAERP